MGNGVWIGHKSPIMPGVKIGNGVVVTYRAVVAADVPLCTIVGGDPARRMKQRSGSGSALRFVHHVSELQ